MSDALTVKNKIRLWKMDTQGSEVSILRGAQKTLSRTEYLLMEWWPYGAGRLGHKAHDLVNCIESSFDQFARLNGGELSFRSIEHLEKDMAQLSNVPADQVMYIFSKKHQNDSFPI